MAKVAKMSSLINLDGKYIWAINNAKIDKIRDLGLTGMKKYRRRICQIKIEVNGLHKDWILALAAFIKHFGRTHDNEIVIKTIKIRWDVKPE